MFEVQRPPLPQSCSLKPQPYQFWTSIGSPRFVVGPMVNQSDLAFRMMTRKYGAQLVYTPMLHARQFSKSAIYRNKYFTTCSEDRPLIVQFCGNDPDEILSASRFIEDKVDAVDINLGCPQRIAKRGRYGAYLLDEPSFVESLVRQLVSKSSLPITVKIRKCSDIPSDTVEFCKRLEAAGVSMICVHGRTKKEKGDAINPCDWDTIKVVKASVGIPVIANGGVASYQDIERCLEYTGCDAVMSAEGILTAPNLFIKSSHSTLSSIDLTLEYLHFTKLFEGSSRSMIKAHIYRLLYSYIVNVSSFRSLLSQSSDVSDYEKICTYVKAVTQKLLDFECRFPESNFNSRTDSSTMHAMDQSYDDLDGSNRGTLDVENVDSEMMKCLQIHINKGTADNIFSPVDESGMIRGWYRRHDINYVKDSDIDEEDEIDGELLGGLSDLL